MFIMSLTHYHSTHVIIAHPLSLSCVSLTEGQMSNEHDPHRGSTSLSGGSNANDSVRNKMTCVVIDVGTRMRLLRPAWPRRVFAAGLHGGYGRRRPVSRSPSCVPVLPSFDHH